MIASSRPLRALAGLALAIALWLAWRLPAMQADVLRLALAIADRPVMMAARVPAARAVPLTAKARPTPQAHPNAPPARGKGWGRASPQEATLPTPTLPTPEPQRPQEPRPPLAELAIAATTPNTAHNLATAAYTRLQSGHRRQAAALFDAALAIEPNPQWQSARAALSRRWQAGGFALLRDGGPTANAPGSGLPGAAASPILGGGQIGGSLAWLPDPLARRPFAIVARINAAADPAGLRPETAQAAIGLRQTLLPGVTISAERLIALGSATRGNWTLRLAAGGQRGRLEAYGEAGILGSGDRYAGAQVSARAARVGPATLNAASWASLQTGQPDAWRVDAGPSVTAAWQGVRLQADWRQRVAGNAAPGSGPVLTVSAGF